MDFILILLIIGLPWLGALLVWWTGDSHPRTQNTLAVIFSVAAGLAALALIPFSSSEATIRLPFGPAFGDLSFTADGLGVFLAVIATVIGSLAVIFSIDYMHGEPQLGRYYALVLFFIGSMCGLVLTNNMLLMFAFWEMTALCSYALISFNNDDPKAVAGGMKALIITQIGGIGLLLGSILLFSTTGSYDVNQFLSNPGVLSSGMLGVMAFGFLIAAAAKSSQFPFQTWLPDAMEAPTPISALIHAATMVNAGVYLLARFYPAFEAVPHWRTAVIIVGVVTALMAGIMALVADDLKRVLAYSTVSQLGYMVYAVGVGSVLASQFHLMSHSVFKALLFLAAGAVIHTVGTRDMRLMGGLGKQMPLVRNVFIIGSLALAGIPILNGFWSKELILEAGLGNAPGWSYAVMLITAGLTALYTLRCVWLVFFGEPRSDLEGKPAHPAMRVALVPLALGSLTTWLLIGPFAGFLSDTLPYHEIHLLSLGGLFTEIFTAGATYIALLVIAAGISLWLLREKLTSVVKSLNWLAKAATNRFGFESLNQTIVRLTQNGSEALRTTQTGELSWNVFAILCGLIIVLAILLLGA